MIHKWKYNLKSRIINNCKKLDKNNLLMNILKKKDLVVLKQGIV